MFRSRFSFRSSAVRLMPLLLLAVVPSACSRSTAPGSASAVDAAPAAAATNAPLARRLVAEWEPALGAMVAWPLTVPHRLVIELARDARLYTLCPDPAACAEARDWYGRWGIDLARVEFLEVPQSSDASWIRDYGPHTLIDERGALTLADARYELSTPISGLACDAPLATHQNGGWNPSPAHSGAGGFSVVADDAAPAAIARAFALPHLALPFALTGGNLLTDGHGLALSTCVQANENRMLGFTDESFRELARATLGIERYAWISNFEERGIQHIDCLLKLLDSERMLVARPPADHPASALVERIVAEELTPLRTHAGRPFEIVRIDTARYHEDELAAYTNALILNDRVYVPLFGIAEDERALATFRRALPGHEVKGFPFVLADEPRLSPSVAMYRAGIGWTGGDALHCRVRAVFDGARLEPARLDGARLEPARPAGAR